MGNHMRAIIARGTRNLSVLQCGLMQQHTGRAVIGRASGTQSFGRDQIKQLFESLSQGDTSVDEACERVRYMFSESVAGGDATVDHHRALRTGLPEVIFGEGKTPEQIQKITNALVERNPDESVISTRVSPELWKQLQQIGLAPHTEYFETARVCASSAVLRDHRAARPDRWIGDVAVVCAGTTDLFVAEEAAVVCELFGIKVERVWDVGVAGIHRLLAQIPRINKARVVIVVAGMDGALPSAVAGLVDAPVVAVPTSVGYGANFGGVAAMLTMLNSCATGVSVVNIDNGFGAATMAAKILMKRD